MKKIDSNPFGETLEQELKRLQKENAKLRAGRETDKAKIAEIRKELKKRRVESNTDRRTNEVSFDPVPGHRFSVQIIVLCVLLYKRTNCGLRTVVTILKTIEEVMEGASGKVPSYSTIRGWVLRLGLEMLDYFRKETELLGNSKDVHHISSDIIESDFGIYKAKQCPNKLYGITSLVLILPLYPKSTDYSVADKQDFKVRLAKVKLKDVEVWAKDHLLPNSVSRRTKTLKKAS